MDIRSLRYFTETVRLGSFTEAARSLGITQSTVSKMIRQLEDQIGDELLLRDSRPIELTDTGRVVYDRGREILSAMERLEREIRETQSVSRGHLAIGMPPMINLLFTDVLKRFRSRHPRIEIQLHERTGREVEQRVADGELSVGMSVLPVEVTAGVQVARVATHRIWAVAAPGELKGEGNTLSLRNVAQSPLIMMTDDYALTRLLRHHFAKVGIEPTVAAQSSQWDWTVAMARAGMGVALLPEPFAKRISVEGLVMKAVTQPDITWEIAMIWREKQSSHALNAWLDLCREHFGGDWPPPPEI
jgi:Transcriptional regulator